MVAFLAYNGPILLSGISQTAPARRLGSWRGRFLLSLSRPRHREGCEWRGRHSGGVHPRRRITESASCQCRMAGGVISRRAARVAAMSSAASFGGNRGRAVEQFTHGEPVSVCPGVSVSGLASDVGAPRVGALSAYGSGCLDQPAETCCPTSP